MTLVMAVIKHRYTTPSFIDKITLELLVYALVQLVCTHNVYVGDIVCHHTVAPTLVNLLKSKTKG